MDIKNQALLVMCTSNATKCSAMVHRFLSGPVNATANGTKHRASILSENSTKLGDLFVLNIMFESDMSTLLEIGATIESDPIIGYAAPGTKPLLVPVQDPKSSYDSGFLAILDCYALDCDGLAAELAEAIQPHSDTYQLVCYTTEAPMQGTPLFRANLKLHIPLDSDKRHLEDALEVLRHNGWDITASIRAIGTTQAQPTLKKDARPRRVA